MTDVDEYGRPRNTLTRLGSIIPNDARRPIVELVCSTLTNRRFDSYGSQTQAGQHYLLQPKS